MVTGYNLGIIVTESLRYSVQKEVLYDDIADYLSPDKSTTRKFDLEETVVVVP